MPMMFPIQTKMFQSTYLYKVRLSVRNVLLLLKKFQSTYLYKVRQQATATAPEKVGFNPRTYIRYDREYMRIMRPIVVSIHVPI